jgi:hypothetical protein
MCPGPDESMVTENTMGNVSLAENINTGKKNSGAVIDASKKVYLEENAEKTKHILMSRHQNAGKIVS